MKKDNLKKLVFSGIMLGCISIAQSGVADEVVTTGENIFVAGCGGKSGCGTRIDPQSRNIYQDEESYQGQGQGSCSANIRPQPFQGRI